MTARSAVHDTFRRRVLAWEHNIEVPSRIAQKGEKRRIAFGS